MGGFVYLFFKSSLFQGTAFFCVYLGLKWGCFITATAVVLLKDKQIRAVNHKHEVQLRVIFGFILVNKISTDQLALQGIIYTIFINSQNMLFYKQMAECYQ